ncbi:MAG: septation protein IspZ, partial [Rhodobacteraceae bacterium]|nr:septation protein IspZ [Paracoccaceae bacterium]
MAARQVNPVVKNVLELGPALGFFAVYTWLKDETFTLGGTDYSGFIVVTAGFVPVLLASILALWWLSGKVSRMQVLTAVLVIVFGG